MEIQLEDLRRRLAERKHTLSLTPQAKAQLAERGYDPVFRRAAAQAHQTCFRIDPPRRSERILTAGRSHTVPIVRRMDGVTRIGKP